MIGRDRPSDARMLAYVCRRSWIRAVDCHVFAGAPSFPKTPLPLRVFFGTNSASPASRHTASQVRLMSVSGFPFAPGKTYGVLALSLNSSSSSIAATDNGTRCSRRCFVWADGLVQTPARRSNMSQRAPSTSPRRAPVSIRSRMALALVRSGCAAKARERLKISVSDRYRARFSSRFRCTPVAGLSSRQPHLIASPSYS
jgi:hypothetical protein